MSVSYTDALRRLGRAWFLQGGKSHDARGVGCPDPAVRNQTLEIRLEWYRGYLAESYGITEVWGHHPPKALTRKRQQIG